MIRRYNRASQYEMSGRRRDRRMLNEQNYSCRGGKCVCDECNEDEIVDEISIEELEELTDCYKGRYNECSESRKSKSSNFISLTEGLNKINKSSKRMYEDFDEFDEEYYDDEDFDDEDFDDEFDDEVETESDYYDNEGNWNPVWKTGVTNVYRIQNIDWDCDGDFCEGLPTNIVLTVNLGDDEDETDAENYISDYLSDRYEFCHNGFDMTLVDSDGYDYKAGDEVLGVIE